MACTKLLLCCLVPLATHTLTCQHIRCVIGAGGKDFDFFYLIDIASQQQTKLKSRRCKGMYAPCFINGGSELVAIGGTNGHGVEIWSVESKKRIGHMVSEDKQKWVSCTYSANNILAVGFHSNSSELKLWDVRSWELIHSAEYTMVPRYLHLTADCKYLTIGGSRKTDLGEKCVVLQIKKE